MITIFTGTPGAGKTAFIVQLLMDEIKCGRKVFTHGIPDLLLNVQRAGDVQRWHDGSWLELDIYSPKLCEKFGIDSSWFPRFLDPENMPDESLDYDFQTKCFTLNKKWLRLNVPQPRDVGSLLVIDEAHIKFPQRASGKALPEFVEALCVHRHQGLDIWFISQKPSFLDPTIRGLCSRHIHLSLNPFSVTGARIRYEWAEYQESVNRSSKLLASKSSYKPAPFVFPLYASSSAHTTFKLKMPNIQKFFFLVLILLAFAGYFAYQTILKHRHPVSTSFSHSEAAHGPERSAGTGGASSASLPSVQPGSSSNLGVPVADMCIASVSDCRCYSLHHRVVVAPDVCRSMLAGDWIASSHSDSDSSVDSHSSTSSSASSVPAVPSSLAASGVPAVQSGDSPRVVVEAVSVPPYN